jgi:hypothetical protein
VAGLLLEASIHVNFKAFDFLFNKGDLFNQFLLLLPQGSLLLFALGFVFLNISKVFNGEVLLEALGIDKWPPKFVIPLLVGPVDEEADIVRYEE